MSILGFSQRSPRKAEDAKALSLRKMICFKSREFTETASFTPYQTALRSLLSWRSLREPISLNPNAIALPL